MCAFSQWNSDLVGYRGSAMMIEPMSMEWHFDRDIDDFAVPKDEEIFNRFPSPNSWSSWGKRIGNFDYPEKHTVSGIEEFLHPGVAFTSEVEQLASPHVNQDSRHASNEWNTCSLEHPDPQLDDIALFNEADDIFFRSLFEDAIEIDGAESSFKSTQNSNKDNMISVNLSGEWNHIQDSTNNNNAERCGPLLEKFKEPGFGIYATAEHSNEGGGISMEESVLMELQSLTFQLKKKTKLCFRDSLYRLAGNSRHNTKYSWNIKEVTKNFRPASKVPLSRLWQSKSQKQGKNAIDRSVATLLFNIPGSSEPYFLAGDQASSHLYQPASSVSSHLWGLPRHDAEVPTFGEQGELHRFHHCLSSTTSLIQS